MTFPTETITMGDFNIHIDKIDSVLERFASLLEASQFQQHANFPIHIKGHTLELIIMPIVNENLSTVTCIPIAAFTQYTYHCPLCLFYAYLL